MVAVPKVRRRKPSKAQRDVFGQNVKLDEKGNPIELGHGAPGHETVAHWQARLKAAKDADKRDENEIETCTVGLELAKAEAIARSQTEESEFEDEDDF